MTEKISKEDQDWLDVLSGKSPTGVDPLVTAQALAVREAMVARRGAIEADANRLGNRGLDEIRARLQREGLMDISESHQSKNGWWPRALEFLGIGSVGGGMRMTPAWGVAATLVIAVFVTFQVYEPYPDEASVYRGNPNVTTLIVENPEIRANEIVAGIKAFSSDGVEITRLKDGRIQLKIKDSSRVQEYLLDQRIEVAVIDGLIRIDIATKKK